MEKALTFSLAMIFALSGSLAVLAQSDSAAEKVIDRETLRQQREEIKIERRAAITAEREARITERCEAAQTKIQEILARATTFKDNHTNIFDNWKSKIDSFINRVDNANPEVDTSKLSEDILILEGLIEEARAAFTDYETELTVLGAMSCTENPQAFQDALLAAREYRSVVIDALQSIKNFIQTTIKADLLAIRQSLAGEGDGGE